MLMQTSLFCLLARCCPHKRSYSFQAIIYLINQESVRRVRRSLIELYEPYTSYHCAYLLLQPHTVKYSPSYMTAWMRNHFRLKCNLNTTLIHTSNYQKKNTLTFELVSILVSSATGSKEVLSMSPDQSALQMSIASAA
jgi:hypothetical protein